MVVSGSDFRIGVLGSGNGSNCEAILKACESGRIHGRVAVVLHLSRLSPPGPRLHHLRDSDTIANDADTTFILHREREEKTGMFTDDKPPALAIAKDPNS